MQHMSVLSAQQKLEWPATSLIFLSIEVDSVNDHPTTPHKACRATEDADSGEATAHIKSGEARANIHESDF